MLTKNKDAVKYETKNPIARSLLKNFFAGVGSLTDTIKFANIFEAGCGNGYVTEFLRANYPHASITAIDIEDEKVEVAKARVKDVIFSVGNIYDIPHPEGTYDLVVSTEVLEHLDKPSEALRELVRISSKYILVSVPNEPLWCMANVIRFKYLKGEGRIGNTPGHINHWSKNAFKRFSRDFCKVIAVRTPFPFTILLGEKLIN